jgi:hypothetical protein
MVAGAIVTIVGLGVALVRSLGVPPYWVPVIVGVALFAGGAITWLTSKERQ